MAYLNDIDAVAKHDGGLADEIRSFTSIQDVLEWMRRRSLPLVMLDMVTQDEFCHDAIVPLRDGGRHVSFGMT